MGAVEEIKAPACFLTVDQTLLVFDGEQSSNASQLLTIQKVHEVPLVAWRFQTNSPTRYMVCPNGGVLKSSEPIKIVIELVGNRYNPQHRMLLQAVELKNESQYPNIWDDEAKLVAEGKMQMVFFELGTTLMNLDNTANLNEGHASKTALSQIMELSHTVGADRVKELEDLDAMLGSDIDTLSKNAEQTESLRTILNTQIYAKKNLATVGYKQIHRLEREQNKLIQEAIGLEEELKSARAAQPNCAIM